MALLQRMTWAGLFVIAALAAVACGDDSGGGGTGAGCTTDVECKGDRLCVGGACVDPDDPGASSRDGGPSTGSGDPSSGDAGSADPGSGGSDPGSTPPRPRPVMVDDPELEAACSLNCEARKAASCEMDVGSLDQCLGQCLIIDEVSLGYCHPEQTAHYACLASGGYTCISGYPQQQATCIAEAQALSQCNQMAPCRRYCEQVQGECAPAGEACVMECLDMQTAGFEDTICGIYYMQLVSCWGQGVTCEGDRPAIGSCGAQVAQVADCISSRNHACDGFCWAAEQMGCGATDCVSTCMTETEAASCGYYYERVLDCAIGSRELQMTCEAGEPVPSATACASEIMQHTMCMGM
jgi:hypothetical protein